MSRLLKVSWGRALARTVGQRRAKEVQGEFPLPDSHLLRGEGVVELELLTASKPVYSSWTPSTNGEYQNVNTPEGTGAKRVQGLTTSQGGLFVGLNPSDSFTARQNIHCHSTTYAFNLLHSDR